MEEREPTLSEQLVITLSDQVYGNQRFDQYLLAFHGQALRVPQDPGSAPEPAYIRWHRREVFKGEMRYTPSNPRMRCSDMYEAEERGGEWE